MVARERERKKVGKRQFGVFAAEIVEHELVRGAEVVDVGLAEGRAGELDVSAGAVGGDVEALSLQQRVSLHAPVLVRRAHHCVPLLHPF